MKRTQGWVALIVLGLALAGPSVLNARSKSGKHPAQTQAQKQSEKYAKSYNKELRKAEKHQAKLQKKQMKQWKKDHPTRTVV